MLRTLDVRPKVVGITFLIEALDRRFLSNAKTWNIRSTHVLHVTPRQGNWAEIFRISFQKNFSLFCIRSPSEDVLKVVAGWILRQPLDHDANHCKIDPGLRRFREDLIVSN